MNHIQNSFDAAKRSGNSILQAFFDKLSPEQLDALTTKRNLDKKFQKFPDVHLTPEISLSLFTDGLNGEHPQTFYRFAGDNLLEKGNVGFANNVAKRMGIAVAPRQIQDGTMVFAADVANVAMVLQKHCYSIRPTEEGIPIATFNNYNPALSRDHEHSPG